MDITKRDLLNQLAEAWDRGHAADRSAQNPYADMLPKHGHGYPQRSRPWPGSNGLFDPATGEPYPI